ncbi:auxin-induced protein 22D-like [Curcuma longa]|uniref:auxin-induced protein 22D-like n=1 Tax=Curcuma longa TaxID=136217 RepID=UPI003D9F3010
MEVDLDNFKATELTLSLPGSDVPRKSAPLTGKRSHEECCSSEQSSTVPPAKAQAVGWPPVRSYRTNSFRARKNMEIAAEQEKSSNGGIYVKVSMDGAPYLRKLDLRLCKGYEDLTHALNSMFECFSPGSLEGHGDECGFSITYEDKDGDWMLAGDVPWEMFISSCKRLRIMKGSDARGLASRP